VKVLVAGATFISGACSKVPGWFPHSCEDFKWYPSALCCGAFACSFTVAVVCRCRLEPTWAARGWRRIRRGHRVLNRTRMAPPTPISCESGAAGRATCCQRPHVHMASPSRAQSRSLHNRFCIARIFVYSMVLC
jgi:hypothetical protein